MGGWADGVFSTEYDYDPVTISVSRHQSMGPFTSKLIIETGHWGDRDPSYQILASVDMSPEKWRELKSLIDVVLEEYEDHGSSEELMSEEEAQGYSRTIEANPLTEEEIDAIYNEQTL